MTASKPLPSASPAVALLDRNSVLAAVCEPMRCSLLEALADGTPRAVNELAAKLGRPADGIAKHLRALRDARIVNAVTPAESDGRKQYYAVPELFRAHDAAGKPLLDFGGVLLRFG